MAKKKRKTRREKELLKTHKFSQNTPTTPIFTDTKIEKPGKGNGGVPKKPKDNVPGYIIKDLKKVAIITGLIVAFVVILWILAYHTNILDPLFHRVNVKY
ncbi:MAG: hypothetical protein WC437_03650 [Patescibacteria group bacterium]